MTKYLSNEGCVILAVNAHLLPSKGEHFHDLTTRLNRAANVPVCDFAAELLDRQKLFDLIVTLKGHGSVKRVLLAGGYLEDQISVLALHLLAEGYEITLLEEWLEPGQPAYGQTYKSRLIQAGAVQSTLRQMIYQWSVVAGDISVRDELVGLLNFIDSQMSDTTDGQVNKQQI
jgi:hypothetical protein